jgi:predicted RNA-binding Zn-ribbon protein involved in translation (DUF1610 family)
MKLILLRCPNCNEPINPDNDDVVIACPNCHTPIAIAVNGAQKMTVRFAMPDNKGVSGNKWYPFWVFEGRAHILRRETQGGSRSGRKDSEKLWRASRRLYVPAWDIDMHNAQEIGSRLIQEQPDIHFVNSPENGQLISTTVTPKDARKLLEFIILAIEARRRDWLKDLDFNLEINNPELWGMPEESF